MKADMSEQSAIECGLMWRGFRWAAVGVLLTALVAGCHRAETSADSEPPSPGGKDASAVSSNASTAATGTPTELLAGNEKFKSGNPTDISLPPPKYLRRKLVTAQFPDKTPQSTWMVKVYSDGSEINDGPHTEFYPNGNKLVEGQYLDGKSEGKWNFWGTNGKVIKTETYRNGKFDGAWTLFREDGSKERDVSYKAGKRDGKWILYDAAGKNKPVEQQEYKADDSKAEANPDGTWINWYPDGKKKSETHFKNGQIDGEQTRWYPDGNKRESQSFKDGVPDGKRIRWKDNGEKIDEVDFRNGHPVNSDSPSEK
jgi:antitoxin component YwqK of YwqJK toxin-antitoxin module